MKIGAFDTDDKVLVVAEIGNNHEGNFDTARELVLAAAEAGADAVKFQTFRTEHYVSAADAERFRRLKSFELTPGQFRRLGALARAKKLAVISTPLDLGSVAALRGVVDAFKIASGDNTFYPLIERVCRTGMPVIISAGLASLAQVKRTVAFARRHGARGIAVLHCVSAYPVPPGQTNLRAIPFLQSKLDVSVGYSDHAFGIEAAVLAVAAGARIVEKHFTLDHDASDFRDHRLSAEPGEMAELVRRVRETEAMLGDGGKAAQPCEEPGLIAYRRSIVAARNLSKGRVLRRADLGWVRPGGGLRPGVEERLVGCRLRRSLRQGERIVLRDVEH